jgi:hypothetical protein
MNSSTPCGKRQRHRHRHTNGSEWTVGTLRHRGRPQHGVDAAHRARPHSARKIGLMSVAISPDRSSTTDAAALRADRQTADGGGGFVIEEETLEATAPFRCLIWCPSMLRQSGAGGAWNRLCDTMIRPREMQQRPRHIWCWAFSRAPRLPPGMPRIRGRCGASTVRPVAGGIRRARPP